MFTRFYILKLDLSQIVETVTFSSRSVSWLSYEIFGFIICKNYMYDSSINTGYVSGTMIP